MNRDVILVVDDEELNRDILCDTLEDDYEILTAANGREALEVIEERVDDLKIVLLDLMMPEIDGFGVLEKMNEQGFINNIPVIIITGDESFDSAMRCFEYGVSDFVMKPFNEQLVKRRTSNVVDLYKHKRHLEDKVALQTRELRKQNAKLKEQAERLAKYNERIIDILATAVEQRDMESGEHVQRVKFYSGVMARKMMELYPECGLTPKDVILIEQASALHDVGKIAIPDSILQKPGKLTAEEFDMMKSHTTKGRELLTSVEGAWDDDYAQVCCDICNYHHERYDGRGYPEGLVGEEIPISAQIVSLVDVYDALTHERCYKVAFSQDEAYRMITNNECGVFSPKILDCYTKARETLDNMKLD